MREREKVCVIVCVCVCEREREREREVKREPERSFRQGVAKRVNLDIDKNFFLLQNKKSKVSYPLPPAPRHSA